MNYNDFYYPNRSRAKTKNFQNLFNELKAIQNTYGSAVKQEKLIEKYFGNQLSNEIKHSKLFTVLEYYRFYSGGSNIFHFKKDLLELLEKTDVSDIEIKNIKFPYNNFYLSLRELNKPLSSSNDDTIIDGVYVSFHDDSKHNLKYDYWVSFHLCGYSEKRKDIEFKHNVEDNMQLTSDLTFENENSTITDAIGVVHQIMTDTQTNSQMSSEAIEKEINYQLEEYKRLKDNLNLFINCIIYLSTERPDVIKQYVVDLPTHLKTKYEKANTNHKKKLVEAELHDFGSNGQNVGCFLDVQFKWTKCRLFIFS